MNHFAPLLSIVSWPAQVKAIHKRQGYEGRNWYWNQARKFVYSRRSRRTLKVIRQNMWKSSTPQRREYSFNSVTFVGTECAFYSYHVTRGLFGLHVSTRRCRTPTLVLLQAWIFADDWLNLIPTLAVQINCRRLQVACGSALESHWFTVGKSIPICKYLQFSYFRMGQT